MRFSILAASTFAGAAIAAPTFPLPDGFPAPSAAQLKQIETLAGGSLPNSPLPKYLTPGATAAVQLIALNEIFEVAYFTSLVNNITNNVPGYECVGYDKAFILDALIAIQNQEQLHALGANAILATANQTTISPCQYRFPVSDFDSAIALAQTFTDIVIGVLPMAQTSFAMDGGDEIPLVNLLGSIISQESQQDGFFRTLQDKLPSAAPFLTTEGPTFAFSFLKGVIVPGSCPGADLVSKSIPTYPPLSVVSKLFAKNSTVTYAVTGTVDASKNSIAYLSGQNLPVSVPISNVQVAYGVTYFEAALPFDTGFAKGLTVAALVNGMGPFANSSAVAAATAYGPGVLEID